ncbi:hypothetical protein [Neptunitalea lumnitzerae]|uniref:Uncharacterized protein n=1 Tax=Neptunitalea lumnitzerae TaxID=2965509 RepID=A0ABQ5MLN0_9FLAO|nr:hypothetical protein [Neptunitalea sp. Y10]GLB49857.1 hypothetical protein Y10_22250 [Neptunitalea sp. Y10]
MTFQTYRNIIVGILISAMIIKAIFDMRNDRKKSKQNKKRMEDFVQQKMKNDYPEIHNKLLNERVTVTENKIYITNQKQNLRNIDFELLPVFEFKEEKPVIEIYEDDKLIRKFVIDTKNDNPDLTGQFFHSSIRINRNSSVQIDGIISDNPDTHEENGEGIRFQPFFLSDREEMNASLVGKGMFQRGLHYAGLISSGNTRLICICDFCSASFSVQFYHAGFSEIQYFYSSNSKETLLVRYEAIKDLPAQTQNEIDPNKLAEVERQLPKTKDGSFKYYNNFCCPKCSKPFINFQENKEIRPNEYYVNVYINEKPISYVKNNEA